jgi:hypothetical protein
MNGKRRCDVLKHTVESLKQHFSLAELWKFEKELKNRLKIEEENWIVAKQATYPQFDAQIFANGRRKILTEILGDSNKKES